MVSASYAWFRYSMASLLNSLAMRFTTQYRRVALLITDCFLSLQYHQLRVWRCSFVRYSFLSLQYRQLRVWRCSFTAVSFLLSDFVCSATVDMTLCGATVYSFLSLHRVWRYSFQFPVSFLLSDFVCGATVYMFPSGVWRYSLISSTLCHSVALQFTVSLATVSFIATVSFRLLNITTVSYRQLRMWCYSLQFPYSFLRYFFNTGVCNIACSIVFSSGTGFMINFVVWLQLLFVGHCPCMV